MTVCELLDYLTLQCLTKCRQRKQTSDVSQFSSQTTLVEDLDEPKQTNEKDTLKYMHE